MRCALASVAAALCALALLAPPAGAAEEARRDGGLPPAPPRETPPEPAPPGKEPPEKAPDPLAGASSPSGASITQGDEPLTDIEPLDRTLRGFFVDPLRFRYEWRKDFRLQDDTTDRETRTLAKLGVGLDARPIEAVRGRIALRITRSWDRDQVDREARHDPAGQDALDLFEGYGEVAPIPGVPVSARIGRQTLDLGDGRLVGGNEFIQPTRSWDMARVVVRTEPLDLDAFWGRPVEFLGYDDHNPNHPTETTDLFGAYASVRVLEEGALTVEPFYLARHDDDHAVTGERGGAGHTSLVHSPGLRAVGNPGPFTLSAAGAFQWGRRGPDEVRAYGFTGAVEWHAPPWLLPLSGLVSEVTYGSGDHDPADGRRSTFDGFYPAGHGWQGEADLGSWQNLRSWRLAACFELYRARLHEPPPPRDPEAPPRYVWQRGEEALTPHEIPFRLEVDWRFLELAEARDTWYDALLRPIRTDPSGRAGRTLGGELDILFRVGSLTMCAGRFFGGSYVDRTTPASTRAQDAKLLYVEWGTKF